MEPLLFLQVADEWVEGATEAHWRSAVSRSYYAAFHVARQLLEELGFEVERGDRAHAYLTHRLCHSGHAALDNAGNLLIDLRRSRNEADYGLQKTYSRRRAIQDLRIARETIAAFQQAQNEPARTQITDAIREHERTVLRVVTWRRRS